MRKLLAFLLAIALAAAPLSLEAKAPTRRVPWKTFSTMAKDTSGAEMRFCAGESDLLQVMVAQAEKGKTAYKYYTDGTRVVFIAYYDGQKDSPAEILIGQVDPARNDDIPPLKSYTVDEATKRFPGGVCDVFTEKQA